jgi:hypothetical protein
VLEGVARQVRVGFESGFLEDAGTVSADGLDAHVEVFRDIGKAPTRRNQREDFKLAVGEYFV